MRWRVYILRCADGTFYTGLSAHLAQRIAQHEAGIGSRWTRHRLPIRVAWTSKPLRTLSEACHLERAVKRMRREAKARLIAS